MRKTPTMVVVEVQGASVQEYIFQATPSKWEITPLAFRSQVRVAVQVNDETKITLPKLAKDGSNWVTHRDCVLWASRQRQSLDHFSTAYRNNLTHRRYSLHLTDAIRRKLAITYCCGC